MSPRIPSCSIGLFLSSAGVLPYSVIWLLMHFSRIPRIEDHWWAVSNENSHSTFPLTTRVFISPSKTSSNFNDHLGSVTQKGSISSPSIGFHESSVSGKVGLHRVFPEFSRDCNLLIQLIVTKVRNFNTSSKLLGSTEWKSCRRSAIYSSRLCEVPVL